MLAIYRRRIDGNLIGFVVALNGAVVLSSLPSLVSLLLSVVLGAVAFWLSIGACVAYARAKGHPGLWGALGIMPIVGLPLLALFADRCRAAGLPDENFEVALKRARKLELSGDPLIAVTWYQAIVDHAHVAAQRIQAGLVAIPAAAPLARYAKAQLEEYERVIEETGKELEVARHKATMAGDTVDSAEAPAIPLRPSEFAAAASWLGAMAFWLLPAPFAATMGLLGLRDLRRHPSMYGKGRAVFGLSAGLVFSLVLIGLISG